MEDIVHKYESVTSATVSKEYCLHIAHDTSWDNVAIAASDNTVSVLKKETLQELMCYEPHENTITGLRFSPCNSSIVWSSSTDGLVKMWDIRTSTCEKEFKGSTDESEVFKPITCFDVSSNERIVSAGTELVEEQSYLLFWDVRGDKILGSYWDSHSDDITQVKFNPQEADVLATAATDGLINVFDVSQKTEDDALTYCLNAEVSISKLSWLKQNEKYEKIAAITDTESLQYWDIKEAAPLFQYSREEIANALGQETSDECYVISVDVYSERDDPIILTGSAASESCNMLHTLRLDHSNGKLMPYGSFETKQNQLMYRASVYHPQTNTYITGGECGVVRLWRPQSPEKLGKQHVAKARKSLRSRPY